jgi:hypothetical protein
MLSGLLNGISAAKGDLKLIGDGLPRSSWMKATKERDMTSERIKASSGFRNVKRSVPHSGLPLAYF